MVNTLVISNCDYCNAKVGDGFGGAKGGGGNDNSVVPPPWPPPPLVVLVVVVICDASSLLPAVGLPSTAGSSSLLAATPGASNGTELAVAMVDLTVFCKDIF